MSEFNTTKLIKDLYNIELEEYLDKYNQSFDFIAIDKYLCYLIEQSKLSKHKVIQKTNINKFYAYQILNGTKRPIRNKVLTFVFALELDLDDAQKMLKCCDYAILNPRKKRDSIIIYCIIHKTSLMDTNIILYDNEMDLLE